MMSSLAELVAPLSEERFLTLLRERAFAVQRSEGINRFERLLSWDTIERLIERGDLPLKNVHLTLARDQVPSMLFSQGDKPDLSRIRRMLERGASVIAYSLETHVPAIETLARNIAGQLRERVTVVGIVTTGTGGAFKLHHDTYDILILQVEGSKHWRIYDDPTVNPVGGMPPQAPPAHDRVVFDGQLRPGDLLLLPAGYWHECENGDGRSVHMIVTIEPLTSLHVVRALARQALEERDFRRPLTRTGGDQPLADVERTLKRRLIERVGQLSLADLLAEHQRANSAGSSSSH
jgi:ribosomal protein L16 Arg81 hydroxylase